MKKIKILSVILSLSMVLSVFYGCGSKKDDESSKGDTINIATFEKDEKESSDEPESEEDVPTEGTSDDTEEDITYIYAYDSYGEAVELAKLLVLEDGTELIDGDDQYSYYIDLVIENVSADLQSAFGYSEQEARNKLFEGGLRIYSAVDMAAQREIEDVYKNKVTFPDDDPGIQSSMIILDYEGRIAATAGRLGEKTEDEAFNIGTSLPRQPGSCITPLSAYAPAIENDYFTWSSLIANYGITLPGESRPWPTNYGGVTGDPSDLRNLPQAIASSYNTIPARIVDAVSPENCYSFIEKSFGISSLSDDKGDYVPLVLGEDVSRGVTCLEMAAAYATFGNGGIYYTPWCYYKVTNAAGTEVLLEPDREGERVLSEGTADVMLQLLRCVVTYPNGTGGPYAVNGQWNYAKSGTTSENHDKWFCGGTGYYVACAWAGFEEADKHINTSIYGSNPAGKVYKEVMTRVHVGLEYKEIEMSGEAVNRTCCTESGLLASADCESTEVGWYKTDNLPSVCGICGG